MINICKFLVELIVCLIDKLPLYSISKVAYLVLDENNMYLFVLILLKGKFTLMA